MDVKKEFNIITFIKVVATICVFLLHTATFSSNGGFVFTDSTWFLQTPAWGGVWIFFILSGYSNGKSFFGENKKYDASIKSFLKFYLRRFIKIILPTWFFIFLALVFIEPEAIVSQPIILLRVFTLTYYNTPACTSIGATWFVFTLAALYLLTPILVFALSRTIAKINDKKKTLVVGISTIFTTIVLGFLIRFVLLKLNVDWSSRIFVPFYCNLDLYLTGIIVSIIIPKKDYSSKKYYLCLISSILIFLAVIIINTRVYYLANTSDLYMKIYQFVFPSIYCCIIVIIFFLATEWNVSIKARKNIFCILLEFFSYLSFEFYLVHSAVLFKIYPFIKMENPLALHILLICLAFVISLAVSFLLKMMEKGFFAFIYKKPFINR